MTSKTLVFVGGFGDTIERFELCVNKEDVKSSTLIFKDSTKVHENPSFLELVGDRLYCVHSLQKFQGEDTGGLSYFDVSDGALKKKQSQFSCGQDPCHIFVNADWKCAYISNYDSGHFVVNKIKDNGSLGTASYIESFDLGSGVHKERQETSHPHGAYAFRDFIYVVDLGADKIWHYCHQNGISTCEPAYTNTPPGSGPRHMVIHEAYNLAFVLTELTNELLVYSISPKNGALSFIASYTYLNEGVDGENFGAEIALHPSGGFVYLSNRGCGLIIGYKIMNKEGDLEKVETFTTGGTWPRHFAIHSCGQLMLCADQFKDLIEVMSVDVVSGKLERIDSVQCTNKPSCIAFKDL